MNSTHSVVRGRSHFHCLLGDVDIRQLFKLMVHAGQLSLDVLDCVGKFFFDPRDVEINAAVRTSPALFDFAHDAARDVIARQQFRRPPRVLVALAILPAFFFVIGGLRAIIFRDQIEHETLALVIR